ncbi:MAG: hypothetical protein A4E42_00480 [Methanoregulaceae archaeon PtaU1.Bin222]|nr:MAG: hypothetical protein A4E42_00480 [Methanoregulaceae archaeon PtaU1.Bin222]
MKMAKPFSFEKSMNSRAGPETTRIVLTPGLTISYWME